MIDSPEKPKGKKNSIWKEFFFFSPSNTIHGPQTPSVPYYKLFRYATSSEIFIASIGVFCAILMSTSLPLLIIIYGEYTSLLVDRAIGNGTITPTYILKLFGGGRKLTNPTKEEIEDATLEDAQAFGISFIILAVCMFILGAISVHSLNHTALRQIGRIRGKFFMAVLKQDMSWYDTHTNMNFASRVTEDLNKMREGIGDKIAIFMYLVASFVFSIIISFIYGWQLTLVVLTCAPLIILATALVSKIQSSLTVKELDSYGSAGSIAEEVFSSIRTVTAFSGEEKECERYAKKLVPAIKQGQRKGFFSGIGNGTLWLIIYCSDALAFWYGVELIIRDRGEEDPLYTPAVLIIVFFGILTGAQSLGMTSPYLEAFSIAKGSAAKIFSIIDSHSKIDPFSTSGLKPETVTGNIEFKDVHFHYPSRPDVKVLQGLNLSVKAGETVALVGSSGCGKSTAIQLLQRLYDPTQGDIYFDGNEISSLNVKWLRSQIGVVGQEPVLFNTTVRTNISYGKLGATQQEIEFAAKQANCHDFIKKLPKGYDTHVSNAQLSGGQKQRIAIARALISEPRILLLDEATSALDLQSEAKVQKTLDQARLGRTTIIVAHRLSTIRNANRIVVINNGVVVESGSHDELINLKGHYYDLVATEAAAESKNINQEKNLQKLQKLASFTESCQDENDASNDNNEENEETYGSSFIRIIKMNKPEYLYILIGVTTSILIGASFPAFAVLFGEIYRILSLEDPEEVRSYSKMYSLLFVLVAILTGIASFLQSYTFSVAGVRLTTRLRQLTFSSMIKQEIAWYDDPKNAVGALCSRLSDDASSVQGATGTCVGAFVQSFSTLVLGLIVGLYYSWKMGLVCFAVMPLVLSSVYLEQKVSLTFGIAEKKYIEQATRVAVEAISNIRTVASLCQEQTFYNNYMDELANVNKALKSKTRLRGLVYAFGQSVPFLGYAISLWYGGYLVAKEGLPYDYIIKVSEALIFGAWVIGQALAFAPNFNSAKLSAARIFKILDREPEITSDPFSNINDKLNCEGNVFYKNVNFHYPTRPEVQVLKDFSLEINSGKTIALVGFSGCGKSTVIQLLQRFYDPDSGALIIDGFNIKNELSLPCLRKQLGIVSQEPVLFDRTIAENIAYGDNSRTIPMFEIVEAAKQANIHNFITSLPLGYDTRLGAKGTQLSGGQKQRIAIARALVRQPRILLLDEATSALDRQSEKVVQEALDKAQKGRTCIIIAHRLITIKDADLICVMENGQIVEIGTHNELLAKGGLYYQLQNLSSKEN